MKHYPATTRKGNKQIIYFDIKKFFKLIVWSPYWRRYR